LIKSEPTLLYYNGTFQEKAMKKERIDRSELKQAIRKSGHVTFDKVAAIILESDGTLTVMSESQKRELEKEDFIFINEQ
ncbi:MAG: YetF domain-containing protein, partial [Alkalibacterium sp.]